MSHRWGQCDPIRFPQLASSYTLTMCVSATDIAELTSHVGLVHYYPHFIKVVLRFRHVNWFAKPHNSRWQI